MTAQQDLMYGRRSGAWASKPVSAAGPQKTVVPVRGCPFPLTEIAVHTWSVTPAVPDSIPFGGRGRLTLEVEHGLRCYQWEPAS